MTLHEALILLNMDELFGYKQLDCKEALIRKASALDKGALLKELDLAGEMGVDIIDIFDRCYPENLKRIASPPVVLYVKGGIVEADCDAVALVGTRRPTHYGIEVCGRLARGLAEIGITVVSGLARGIDTAAHRGAMKARSGRTIAVLGSGLENIYPPENRGLGEGIAGRGAVISEFPMSAEPLRRHFPRRNRLISGLSLGVVVVEAAEESGSLITANFALDENKEVFAVPGRAGSRENAGAHALLKQGAKLVDNVEDIIGEIRSVLKYDHSSGATSGIEEDAPHGGGEESLVRKSLGLDPLHFDRIAAKTRIPANRLSLILLNMQLRKVVKELPGRMFVRA